MGAIDNAVSKAVAILNAVKAEYKIVMPDGTEHGSLAVAQQSRRKSLWREEGRTYGELAAHIRPFLKDMKVGGVAKVPCAKFTPQALASSMSAQACHLWGKQSAITATAGDHVEILRVR